MEYQVDFQGRLIGTIKKLIYVILRKEGLLQGDWHLGKVESIVSNKMLSVYVDGSLTPQNIPCSPDTTFQPGDEVWIKFINRQSSQKFVISKRGV